MVPGGEAAGKVVAVGDGVDRVVARARRFSARRCTGLTRPKCGWTPAKSPRCPRVSAWWKRRASASTYGTSLYALQQRAALQPGETLLVLGAAGGVGTAAVQIGKAMGAKVIAVASNPEKLKVAAEAGRGFWHQLFDGVAEGSAQGADRRQRGRRGVRPGRRRFDGAGLPQSRLGRPASGDRFCVGHDSEAAGESGAAQKCVAGRRFLGHLDGKVSGGGGGKTSSSSGYGWRRAS